MKYGTIIYSNSHNYGDDLQTIAASRLLPKIDYYLDRENLNFKITSDKIKLITNGWFMDKPFNWPPTDNIHPLFISFHITHHNNCNKLLFNKTHIEYYKRYEPIGCRDYNTVNLFKENGIKAYFSGCLTMTFDNKFKDIDRTDEIIFVDAINNNIPKEMRKMIYKKLVPDSIQEKIVFLEHYHSEVQDNRKRLDIANKLIERYSKAHLVVTSRIHVALPCLALGTPVLFLDLGFNTNDQRNRFGGLIDYFNTINNSLFPSINEDIISKIYRKLRLYNIFHDKNLIDFDWENPMKPPTEIGDITHLLKEKVKSFINT